MFDQKRLRWSVLAVAALVVWPAPSQAKKFTPGEKVSQMMATKYKMPVFFALPDSARAKLPDDINTADTLVDYRHPENSNVGLRLVVTKRSGWADRLAKSGLVQTGDLLLTFRPEWGGAGAYPNVQMGISHTGVAYVKGGQLYNVENPMNSEYLGFSSEHYRTLNLVHVIRPRNLTAEQRANLATWAGRLRDNSKKIYPAQIKFNDDYNAPKYSEGKPVTFVKQLGQTALGQSIPNAPLGLYCSEFAWSLLSLKNCDPAKSSDAFKGSSVPSCVSQPMKPMEATGDYIGKRTSGSNLGLADGPLAVIDGLNLPEGDRKALLDSVFVANSANMSKLSAGHRTVAETMQPKFSKLSTYYQGSGRGVIRGMRARLIGAAFRRAIPDNYSPTSFLINTLLPADNSNRSMDYVATIVIE
jgi:hypothetical protein